MTISECTALLAHFRLDADAVACTSYGEGHINETYHITLANGKQYVLQSINHSVFKNTDGLMKNFAEVTAYLKKIIRQNGGDPERQTLTLIPTVDGKTHFYDENGTPWRVCLFLENTFSFQSVKDPADFYFSAKAFAQFAAMLRDYPAAQLTETIPSFHNTKIRYYNLIRAIQNDSHARVQSVGPEISFALNRIARAGLIIDAIEDGRIPLRVTHNDTKLNNVLIDRSTGRAICVCDLDTIMPGSILYDFGDAIRFGTNPAAEDEPDLTKVRCDLTLFDAYVKGTMEVLGEHLTETEVDFLPLGAWTMTLECGIRFLTDYLEGDVYFKTHREGQNLDRCRTQFKMVADMEAKEADMNAIVNQYR